MKLKFLAIVLLVSGSCALYDESPDVVKLTPDSFNQLVTNSSDVWIVMFYASWCGWSRVAVPEYSKAACALKGIAKLGAIDADVHYDFGSPYVYSSDTGYRYYPRIKLFSNGQHVPYKSGRNAEKYIEKVLIAAKKQVEDRLSEGRAGLWVTEFPFLKKTRTWKSVRKRISNVLKKISLNLLLTD